MDYNTIVKETAPCGIDCARCVNYAHGDIRRLSVELSSHLSGFEKLASAFSKSNPMMNHYDSFAEILSFFANATCQGCRSGSRCFPGCAASECVKEKKVDFCFECGEFPCEKNSYPPMLEALWKKNNEKMKSVGVETFYSEQKSKPRY
jgi:hypothetical protein